MPYNNFNDKNNQEKFRSKLYCWKFLVFVLSQMMLNSYTLNLLDNFYDILL